MAKLLAIPTSYRAGMGARVERKDGATNVEFFATEPMMRLRVESSVSQQSPNGHSGAGLPHGRWQERRIVAGAPRHDRRQQEMAAMVAHQGELQPGLIAFHPATPPQKMGAGMMVFQAGGIHAGRDVSGDQQKFLGPRTELIEQLCRPPFLASRWAAFCRVVK